MVVGAMSCRRLLSAGACIAVLAGCASPTEDTVYRWGVYEDLMYLAYSAPDEADPVTQVQRLDEDIARTRAEGKRVPPGVHAHLGFLHYSLGDRASARAHFMRERELFPESATFIDGILSRMKEDS